jgi:hypothetical protein
MKDHVMESRLTCMIPSFSNNLLFWRARPTHGPTPYEGAEFQFCIVEQASSSGLL